MIDTLMSVCLIDFVFCPFKYSLTFASDQINEGNLLHTKK